MEKACENCRYFEYLGQYAHSSYGSCRRAPPKIIDFIGKGTSEDRSTEVRVKFASRFPAVQDDDWCGTWQPGPEWEGEGALEAATTALMRAAADAGKRIEIAIEGRLPIVVMREGDDLTAVEE